MSYPAILSAFVAALEGVHGIGKVHPVERLSVTWEEFLRRHVSDGRVNDWEVTRTATGQAINAFGNAQGYDPIFHVSHSILVRGGIGLQDSAPAATGSRSSGPSETDFHGIVDAIMAAYRSDLLLGGLLILPALTQANILAPQMFGGVLVHRAEIAYSCVERIGS